MFSRTVYLLAVQWNDLPESKLASLVNAKKLDHPTNSQFDPAAWQAALDAIPTPSDRDRDLAAAAMHYGRELASLRENEIPNVTKGLSRARLIRVLAAHANQQFLSLRSTVIDKLKTERRAGGVFDPERNQQMLISNVGGQEMTPDDMITFQIDSLPHWLFHIWQVGDDVADIEMEDTATFAGRAMVTSSIEHSLRYMWLSALWNGDHLIEQSHGLIDAPADRDLAERWFIWDQRQHMLFGAEHTLDAGERIVMGGKLPPVRPAIARTVIRMERPPGGHRRYITGRAIGAKAEQRGHVHESTLLEKQYTGLFLDEPLPRSPGASFTCRELSHAWWVLQDLAHVEIADLTKRPKEQIETRLALTVQRKDLAAILSDCLAIDEDRAGVMVDWLTCDPTDTSRLFSKSFWSEPLVPEPGSERRHILLSPLLVGAPVKRIAAWMEKGGISDNKGIKGRGKLFENHVRQKLLAAVASNSFLTDAQVAVHGLKRKGTSEEIDLLVRIGRAVIVGEVKCFVAPSEPLEKRNHLSNLSKATEQGEAKRVWAEANRGAIASVFGITDAADVGALKMYPVVVLNHGMGMGLERHGVPVVDIHYLALLLGAGSYRSGARFERGVGVISEETELYRSQADLENRLGQLLAEPVVLERFAGTLRWREVPFITSEGQPFFIQLPALAETPAPNLLRDMPYRGMPARRLGRQSGEEHGRR